MVTDVSSLPVLATLQGRDESDSVRVTVLATEVLPDVSFLGLLHLLTGRPLPVSHLVDDILDEPWRRIRTHWLPSWTHRNLLDSVVLIDDVEPLWRYLRQNHWHNICCSTLHALHIATPFATGYPIDAVAVDIALGNPDIQFRVLDAALQYDVADIEPRGTRERSSTTARTSHLISMQPAVIASVRRVLSEVIEQGTRVDSLTSQETFWDDVFQNAEIIFGVEETAGIHVMALDRARLYARAGVSPTEARYLEYGPYARPTFEQLGTIAGLC